MARIPSAIADPPRRTNVASIYPAIAVPDGQSGSTTEPSLARLPSHDGRGRLSRPACSTLSSKPFY